MSAVTMMIDQTARAHARPAGTLEIRPGSLSPRGATPVEGGVNFAVHSADATGMTLVLFRRGAVEPFAEIPFPEDYRVGGAYAMTVLGIEPDDIEYGYRADGPFDPKRGHRFDSSRVLLDPYARAIGGLSEWGRPADRAGHPYRSRPGTSGFDWQGVRSPGLAMRDLVIYEAHLRGFTRHPSSGVGEPGTFQGFVEKVPYLRELGVNCVELLPVFEFDECDNPRTDPLTGRRLYNYWGYSTLGYFAPKASYAGREADTDPGGQLKTLIRELHRSGIEVILDVVFNHTAEGDERGPALSFRGLDNRTFYMLTPDGAYLNFSGTGNTVNANHPVVRAFILDCLRHWVTEYHVDGFRFDLASALCRAPDGTPLADPPLLAAIAADPVLRDTKLIAEAWDAGGLYQVGSFPHYGRWSEWNGRYRDEVRRFLKGDPGMTRELASRLAGSPDLYGERGPVASVNLITSHDGFTLRDLFSYNEKHNHANGEENRDGDNANHSWNCGAEGETDDPEVLSLRSRQVRNALALLLMSHGVPMLVAGDEMGRTQQGNNNAYCHDSELSWLDWAPAGAEASSLVEFARRLIRFRGAHPALRRQRHATDRPVSAGPSQEEQNEPTGTSPLHSDAARTPSFPEISWHGRSAWEPDWSDQSRLLAVLFAAEQADDLDLVYLAANAHWEGAELELPCLPAGLVWRRFADTAAPPPYDAYEPGREPRLADQSRLFVGPRSTVVLIAGPDRRRGGRDD